MPLIAWALVALVAATVLTVLVAKKPADPTKASLADFDVPQVGEGTPEAVVFGDVWVQGWQVLWYGNLRTISIKQKSLFSSTTLGYWYLMSLLSGICRGPINELVAIKVGDQVAWTGSADDSGSVIPINSPNLFGGKKKEGGIQGLFRLMMGKADQIIPGASGNIGIGGSGPNTSASLPNIKGLIQAQGYRVSEFRGVVTLYYDGVVSALSAYLKTWQFRVRRSSAGWESGLAWYPEKAAIYLRNDLLILTSSTGNLSCVSYGSNGTVTVETVGNDGDTLTVNGQIITLRDSPHDPLEVAIGASPAATAANIAAEINSNPSQFDADASVSGAEISLSLTAGDGLIHAMNPSHIIYEVQTNSEWGRGLDAGLLDENSFIYAADTLYKEGFGLCLAWYRKESIGSFLQTICDHIGAVIYVDRTTGKVVLRLIRDDYNIEDLPLFDENSGLLSIIDDDSAATSDAYNEVLVTGTDPLSGSTFQVKADHLASVQSSGAINTNDETYEGLPTGAIGARVALRDLGTSIIGLKRFKITFDRRAWKIAPCGVFRISAPKRGIQEIVLRAGDIQDGTLENGTITISAVQDVFGLPATAFITPTKNTWTNPSGKATPPGDELLEEMSFRDLIRNYGAGEAGAFPAASGILAQVAAAPGGGAYIYALGTRTDITADFDTTDNQAFTRRSLTTSAVAISDTVIHVADSSIFSVGEAALLGSEYVAVDGLAPGTITVRRGCVDTVPMVLGTGVPVWAVDDAMGTDGNIYADGTTVQAIVLTQTATDILDPSDGIVESLTIENRANKPYPPAGVQVSGDYIDTLAGPYASPVLTWVERNRTIQADRLVGFKDAAISGEAGTTYTVRVYDGTSLALLSTHAAIAADNFNYDLTAQTADGLPASVYFELESVRAGLPSWTNHRFKVNIT